tara:strand:- start:2725 stop:3819 length:1095 start_codon:yes stop_codon:yes gene_type:complete
MIGLYIHIPFCEKICNYCDFVKGVPKNQTVVDNYIEALVSQIEHTKKQYTHFDTIYIGGGTPSMLNKVQLETIFRSLDEFSPIEYTVEVNPESYTNEKGLLLKKYGINRVSFGVQTFNDKHLKRLNRAHDSSMIEYGISDLKRLGINNISVDLIFGLEHQSIEELNDDLDKFLDLDVNHISTYSLIIEENTYFSHQLKRGKYKPTDQDVESDMYDLVKKRLRDHGYKHYEISNFAKKGFESKHNQLYWTQQKYIGLGLGAHGFNGTHRIEQTKSMSKYLKQEFDVKKIFQDETILRNDHLLFLLRLSNGISLEMVKKRYNKDIYELYPSLLKKIDEGLLEEVNNHLRLTHKGQKLGNLVFMVFV